MTAAIVFAIIVFSPVPYALSSRPDLQVGGDAGLQVGRESLTRRPGLQAGRNADLQVRGPVGLPERLDEQLRAIFERAEYRAETLGPTAWIEDGRRYTAVTRGQQRDLVAYETGTGRPEVLVSGKTLAPQGSSQPLSIAGYSWSTDRSKLLIFTNTRRVWRQNTRGDYYVYTPATGALKRVGGTAAEASLMFAKFSPDGSRVAYVRAQNIYVEDLGTGATTGLTSDGGGDTINGTSDWVNEEEFDLRDGFRWSPDGSAIAYWQFDTSDVGRFTLVNDTDALYPTITQFPYPKPGTTNSAVRIGIVPSRGGATTWVKTPGAPRDSYIPRMDWADKDTLLLQHVNRLQNTNDVLLADAATGAVRRVLRDQSRTWVDIVDDIQWLPSRDSGSTSPAEFLWVSEKDGWRHAYAVSRQDGRERLLTKLAGDIASVEAVDAAGRRLYFTASPENSTERYLFMAPLDGSGSVERVTPRDQPGTHTYDISPDGRWAIHTWSRFDNPPRTDIVSMPEHRSVRLLVDNRPLAAKVAALVQPPVEFVKVDIAPGVVLDGYVLKPRQFDRRRRYPVLVHVYGEPASTTVNDRWGSSTMLFHRALTAEGFIVVSFDNRGTPALKGADWRKVVYGAVGELSSRDQAEALRRLAADRPYLDLSRVAVWGWSGGGSNTLNLMFRQPDLYKVGVAVAPVPDQRLYDTIYQERYMGLPDDNPKGYLAGSPINFAEGLKGRLLIVHGSGDDNVHYQGTERLINKLIALGKTFDVMVYPNRTHSISEGPGTQLHVYRLVARYLLEHMPPAAGEVTEQSARSPHRN